MNTTRWLRLTVEERRRMLCSRCNDHRNVVSGVDWKPKAEAQEPAESVA
jgi:hypothetical protein